MKNVIIAAVILFSQVGVVLAGDPDKDLHKKCLYPTVMIKAKNADYGGNGTGVIVKSIKKGDKFTNYVFTCAHILVQTPPRIVVPEDDKEKAIFVPAKFEYTIRVGNYKDWSHLVSIDNYDCKVIYRNTSSARDIAVVTFLTDKEMPTAEICHSKFYIGNEVCRVGCGLLEPFRVDFGRVNSLAESSKQDRGPSCQNTHRVSAPTLPGDSGGPVYHENKLIGVAQLIRGFQPAPGQNMPVFHMTYVIPIERFTQETEIMDCLAGKSNVKDAVIEASKSSTKH